MAVGMAITLFHIVIGILNNTYGFNKNKVTSNYQALLIILSGINLREL